MSPVEALRQNVSETFIALALAVENTEVSRTPHYWLCRNSLHHPLANFAIHLDVTEESLGTLLQYARSYPHFRIYVLPGDSPGDLAARLVQRGLSMVSLLIGMHLNAPPVNPPPVARLARPDELPEVSEFIVQNFFWNSPEPFRYAIREALTKAQAVPHHFYVSTVEDQIVAAGTLTYTDGVAGLYNVCVHPRHRNRGLGSALVRQLSALATQEHRPLVLLCEPELRIWYQSLGFEEIGESRAFVGFSPTEP
jgi:N-acetylglutamate synthase-like GNAT family acetyltransferase